MGRWITLAIILGIAGYATAHVLAGDAGRYNASVIAAVRSAGYIGATTTTYGVAHPSQGRFTLDRIRVDGTDTATSLDQKLTALDLLE